MFRVSITNNCERFCKAFYTLEEATIFRDEILASIPVPMIKRRLRSFANPPARSSRSLNKDKKNQFTDRIPLLGDGKIVFFN